MLISDPWLQLRELTAARIALGRTGHSLPTRALLDFQLAHARARDAVWQPLTPDLFSSLEPAPLELQSAAPDRSTYLRRPDLGRRLSVQSSERISRGHWDVVVIVADGLSANAVHRYALPVLAELKRLWRDGWRMAPVSVVKQGRVAISDEIGERIGASVAVILIGERPGLTSPDSLGAYVTWGPRVGRTDAERNCVSNIRRGGLDPVLGARRIAAIAGASREQSVSGVALRLGEDFGDLTPHPHKLG